MIENSKSNGRLTADEWKKVEDDFLKFDGTIGEFCEQYEDKELFFSTVYKHSSDGEWIKKRERFKNEEMLSGKVDFDSKVMKSLDKAMKIIEGNVTGKNVDKMTRTLETIVNTRYRIMDIPLPKQRIENLGDPKSPAEEFEDKVKEQLQEIKNKVENENGKADSD